MARTKAQVQRQAYWIGWKADLRSEVRRCNPCAWNLRETSARYAGLRHMLVDEPWEEIAVDITIKHP